MMFQCPTDGCKDIFHAIVYFQTKQEFPVMEVCLGIVSFDFGEILLHRVTEGLQTGGEVRRFYPGFYDLGSTSDITLLTSLFRQRMTDKWKA